MIRVAIIDDSPTMRALISAVLRRDPLIEVVGAAGSISEARALIRTTNPDVVTLDLELPDMDGFEFLEKLMRLRPLPVIVVSSHSNPEIADEAMRMGAASYYTKPANGGFLDCDDGRLAGLVRRAAGVNTAARPGLIAIGASTGGIEALDALLAGFPADCPPTLIVQHTQERYVAGLAQLLDSRHRPRVVAATADAPLRRGTVVLAASNDAHLLLGGQPGDFRARLRPTPPESGHRPSVDVLFQSVAAAAPGAAIGVLLTGMGSDGAHGLLAMRRAGCTTVAQDEHSSTVYGMPRAAAELGAAEHILPLDRIAAHVLMACAT